MTAADVLIETLIDWGVDVVFGLPGDGINGLMESLRTHKDQIRFVQVRHEESRLRLARRWKAADPVKRRAGERGSRRRNLSFANKAGEGATAEIWGCRRCEARQGPCGLDPGAYGFRMMAGRVDKNGL